jgi:hypothetical protein
MLFATALFAVAQPSTARPGTVNYTEGQVTLDGNSIGTNGLGSTAVAPGQILQTGSNGKAEMLLFPGAVLRMGPNSSLTMISPSLTNTRVELRSGEAVVEVDQIQKETLLNVVDNGATIRLEQKGIYSIRADQPMVAVYDGKAEVLADDHNVTVDKGKELSLAPGARLKPQKFDRNQGDELYAWSKSRAGYMAEANMASAQMVFVNNYPGWWYGTGWYWNPWFDSWAFVPGGGYLYSPFGFGFYSPAYWYSYAPRYYYPGVGIVRGGLNGRAVTSVARTAPAVRGEMGFAAAPHAAMPMGGAHFGGFGGGRR